MSVSLLFQFVKRCWAILLTRLCFFSVRRLLGFRQVVAQVCLCISELCRNVLSLRIGSIKREQMDPYTVQYCPCTMPSNKNQKTETATKRQTQTQKPTSKNPSKKNKKPSSCWTELLYANYQADKIMFLLGREMKKAGQFYPKQYGSG